MNDHIMVAFKNDKSLSRQKIISEDAFSVTNVFYDKTHIYTIVNFGNDDEFFCYIDALAEFIIDKYESKILKRIIKVNNPEISNMAVKEIIELKDDEGREERKRIITDILKEYFSNHENGNVEGLVTFRLEEYKKSLLEISEKLIDMYYLNKEYEDFIELLRYFISVQNTRAEMVYIVVNDGEMYSVLDEEKHDITKEVLKELVPKNEIKYVTYDDLLISMLISIAPKRIIVNNKEKIKNIQLFETVEKVFEKVEYK